MPKITKGNYLYFYQLFSTEIGTGRQDSPQRFEEVLAAADVDPQDVACESVEELLGELDFMKLTVFKKGRVLVTVSPRADLDELLEKAANAAASKGDGTSKSWKRARKNKNERPAKPRHLRRVEEVVAGTEVEPAPVTEPEAESAAVTEPVAVAEPEVESAPAAEPEVKPMAELVSEPEPEPKPEPEPEVVAEPEAAPEPKPEIMAKTETEPAVELAPEPEPEPETEVMAVLEAAIEPEAAAKPEAELEPEAEAEPEPQPAPAPARERVVLVHCTPKLKRIHQPEQFSRDVQAYDRELRELFELLPDDVALVDTLDASWEEALRTGSVHGTHGELTFPLNCRSAEERPLAVTIRRTARATSGKDWRLAAISCEEV